MPKRSNKHSPVATPPSSDNKSSDSAINWTAQDGTSISFPTPEYTLSTKIIPPPPGRKSEQAWFNAWKDLVQNANFRNDIEQLRKQYPSSYWERRETYRKEASIQSQQLRTACDAINYAAHKGGAGRYTVFTYPIAELRFNSDAESLASKWGFKEPGAYHWLEWIEWLVQHWDPSKEELPLWGDRERYVMFYHWVIVIEECRPRGEQNSIRKVSIVLRPGVSESDGKKALKLALEAMGSFETNKVRRPRITSVSIVLVKQLFEQMGIPAPGKEKAMISKVRDEMLSFNRPISESAIANLLRQWKQEKGLPVKRLMTYKRDVQL